MFKKLLIGALLATAVNFSYANAASIEGLGENFFYQSANNQAFTTIKITAEADDEITTEHGIVIMIPNKTAMQWDDVKNKSLVISGTGLDRLAYPIQPVISDDFYKITLAVRENFKKDEYINIDGLTPRTYPQEITSEFLRIDINGDGLSDDSDFYRFSVRADDVTDFIPPHKVKNAKLNYNKDQKKVELSWENPKDYDYFRTVVSKKLGQADIEVYQGSGTYTFDNTYIEGQEAVYEIFVNDTEGNSSEKVVLKYPPVEEKVPEEAKEEEKQQEPEVEEEVVEEPEESTDTPKTEEGMLSEAEMESLSRLRSYYRIRYQIKCLRKGISPLDSNCLWSKINLVYAQEFLKKASIEVSLTANEISVIAKRLRFSEARYQKNCVEAGEPAKYCTALGKALKRAKYFINNDLEE